MRHRPLIFTLLALGVSEVRAQLQAEPHRPSVDHPSTASRPRERRLTISVHYGWEGDVDRGPERAMSNAGFDDGVPDWCGHIGGLCSGGVGYPNSKVYPSKWLFGMRYVVRPRTTAELVVGNATAGETIGRREGQGLVSLGYQARMAGTILSRQFGRWRVGAGPALLRAKWGVGKPWQGYGEWRESSTRPGAIVDAGMRLLGGGLITTELRTQYRVFVPSMVEVPGIPGRLSVGYRSWYAGVGLAVRP